MKKFLVVVLVAMFGVSASAGDTRSLSLSDLISQSFQKILSAGAGTGTDSAGAGTGTDAAGAGTGVNSAGAGTGTESAGAGTGGAGD